jgi:peptidyl-dipeptidase A
MISGLLKASNMVWAIWGLCVPAVVMMTWIATEPASGKAADQPATVEEARAFTAAAETRLLDLWIKSGRANWVHETYITDDTERISADADQAVKTATAELAAQARRFDGLQLPDDVGRKLKLLRLSVDVPAPRDVAEAAELSRINSSLSGDYGKGRWCPDPSDKDHCLDMDHVEKIMAESRDPEELKRAWIGWHTIGPPMRERYTRMVELANKGTRELGFPDVGAQWRSNYDMPPDQLAAELDRLWQQVLPLYRSLHTYARMKLRQKYGADVVPASGPIPAHLFGNIWSQQWNNIYDILAPGQSDTGYDLTKILQSRNIDPIGMVKFGERFFVSLGFDPLPETFWHRSMFTRPRDRDVVCHASAWSIDFQNDLRIKMCIQVKEEDFTTIHHELGHNFYQRAYDQQPPLFQSGANDGFHEAIGDTIALSVTPEYLKQIGLLDTVPPASGDIALLMKHALDKVAFLPFGLLVDQWRWKVFSGEVKPADYNKAWWELRRKYQGVVPPVARSEADFDPGAKYHVASNTPYTRYFIAAILQYQFHRALCRTAGYTGPLHRCSIYSNKAAGAALEKMLAMGQSRPWPEALEAMTGEKQMDATAILDYYAPLKKWLDEQTKGEPAGW